MWEVLLQILTVLALSPERVDVAGALTVFGMAKCHMRVKGHRSRQNLDSCVCFVMFMLTFAALLCLPTSAVLN